MASYNLQNNLDRYKKPAIFIDRDGTLIEYVDYLNNLEDLVLYPFSYEAISMINRSDYLCIVVTNQPVVAMNLCDINMVEKMHNKIESLLKQHGCYLDHIFFCPHHPDKRHFSNNEYSDNVHLEENLIYNKECECRKPAIGMIEKAKSIFNIDMEKSWIIGDTTRDIQTGINAGIKTALVRTGKAGTDNRYKATPNFIFDNLKEAVNFILTY
ncbi:MAG: HAD family hydrolase [Desulfamplus sp.]|nr:HAD family hydrolase [Desulfamplus sp.]